MRGFHTGIAHLGREADPPQASLPAFAKITSELQPPPPPFFQAIEDVRGGRHPDRLEHPETSRGQVVLGKDLAQGQAGYDAAEQKHEEERQPEPGEADGQSSAPKPEDNDASAHDVQRLCRGAKRCFACQPLFIRPCNWRWITAMIVS